MEQATNAIDPINHIINNTLSHPQISANHALIKLANELLINPDAITNDINSSDELEKVLLYNIKTDNIIDHVIKLIPDDIIYGIVDFLVKFNTKS